MFKIFIELANKNVLNKKRKIWKTLAKEKYKWYNCDIKKQVEEGTKDEKTKSKWN